MDPTDSDDVDRTLRHVAQRFPDELARALLPEARSLTEIAWTDTQLASRERRLDKSLYVVADGEARVEHAEWQLRWSRGLLARMFEYHALLTIALRDAAKPGERVPSVRSTVVLLGGREAPWPAVMRYRTTPRGEAFSGLRVRVEAVYQRSLAELAARGSAFWMAFAPLAVDATPDAMVAVVKHLRAKTTTARFEELAVTMQVLADADGRARGLREPITANLPKELIMRSWVYTQGLEKGLEKGREEGREEGRVESVRALILETLRTRGLRVTAARRAQIESEASAEVLLGWFSRALTAERTADVFRDAR